MAASSKSRISPRQIEELLARTGLNQQQLAAELGITQGHLSKLKRGLVPGGSELARKVAAFRRSMPRSRLEPWLELVREAGSRSRDAKIAIEAIARMVGKSR